MLRWLHMMFNAEKEKSLVYFTFKRLEYLNTFIHTVSTTICFYLYLIQCKNKHFGQNNVVIKIFRITMFIFTEISFIFINVNFSCLWMEKLLLKIEIVTKSIILNLMSQKILSMPILVSNYNKMCRRAERSNEIKMQL